MGALVKGDNVQYPNTGAAIAKGDVVVMAAVLGVAAMTIAATTGSGTVDLEGVFDLPKVDAAVIGIGEIVLWDVSAGKFDDNAATPASGDVLAGAIAMEGLGATTSANIRVKLTPGAGTVTA